VEGLAPLLPLVAIALLFWLLIIRPASRRQKDQARLQASVGLGDRVMLTSGIYGTVTDLDDDRLQVEIASGVVVTVARGAIGSVVPTEQPEAEAESTDGDAGAEEG
jgi:preprotein translocase subunit YajC